jgi:carboxypeptidase Taq
VHETRFPEELVTEFVRATSKATAVWREARKKNDFASFSPHFKRLVELTREKADCIGYVDHPYDALIDEYEPWMRTSQVAAIFGPLTEKLTELVARIKDSAQVDAAFLDRPFPVGRQEEFGRHLLTLLSYPMDRGRLDVSAHPFTTTLGSDDVRITTRYREDQLLSSIFGTIHETGHALYELGFPEELRGTLLAAGTSLGIHESQSRTWENLIGKSRAFWEFNLPVLKKHFPAQLDNVTGDQFYRAVNKVEPSLIRIEADEVTYSLHVVLRFELELRLLTGDLSVDDAPAAWMEKMESLIGVRPGNDANGILQDTHWASGLMGYFPTYALGNLYGAQFMRKMREDVPDIDKQIASGNLKSILDWLGSHIHVYGAALTADELCKKVTGEDLNPQYFIDYLEAKFGEIYRL